MSRCPSTMSAAPRCRAGASRTRAALAAAVATAGVLAAAAPPASAATPTATPAPKAATRPAFSLLAGDVMGALRLSGAPGRRLTGSVLLRNLTGRAITVRLQRADIRNATNGNADYVTTRVKGDGRWLRLAAARVRLAPHAIRRVTFDVVIPRRTAGGWHYSGIVAVNAAELVKAPAGKRGKRASVSFARVNRQAVPLTVRLPGPARRRLSLRSLAIGAQPAGAGLVLGLRPGGNHLIAGAPIRLRVSRHGKTVLRHSAKLGQLFPGSALSYRIPWPRRPDTGRYRVVGTIRPIGARVIRIDQTVRFTKAGAAKVDALATPLAASADPSSSAPLWMTLALGAGALALVSMAVAVVRLKHRADHQVA